MGSRFENFDIGRTISKLLNTKDPRNFPTELNTDQLQPVIDISGLLTAPTLATPNGGIGTRGSFKYTRNVGALVTAGGDIIGSGAYGVGPQLPNQIAGIPIGYRFDALRISMILDAAGAIAFAGKSIWLRINIIDGGDPGTTDVELIHLRPWTIVRAANLQYVWTLYQHSGPDPTAISNAYGACGWSGGFYCGGFNSNVTVFVDVNATDNSGWPANTTFNVNGLYRSSNNGAIPIVF